MLHPGETFARSYPACAGSVPLARAEVTEFARAAGIDDCQLEQIRLAVSEAVTNAVLHAYERPGGSVSISVTYLPGELWLLVSDQGDGLRVRRSQGLGLGLALIAQLADDLQILSRGTGGTELRMQFRLGEAPAPPQPPRGSASSAAAPA